jgi:plastocyanin
VKLSVLLGAAMIFIAAPSSAATYSGIAKGPSVIWVSDVGPDPAVGLEIRQIKHTFVPDMLIVPIGSAVTFPNDDAYYHSVYSDSPGNAFDIGLYDTGPGKSVRFLTPGIVDVHCHVHGTMHAVLVVVDGPYAQTTQAGEHFQIDGIAPGRHVAHVWSGGTDVSDSTVVVK